MSVTRLPQAQPGSDTSVTVLLKATEPTVRERVLVSLSDTGFTVEQAESGRQALELLQSRDFDCVLLDVQPSVEDADGLLRTISRISERAPTLVMCSAKEITVAVEAVRAGAADFIIREIESAQLRERIERVLSRRQPQKETPPAESPAAEDPAESGQMVIGGSRAMLEVMKLARRVALFPASVLLVGESGTGKELFARWIHRMSDRESGPFVGVNLAAIPSDLVESTLFGHVKGAFTGAAGTRTGKFGQARGGTLLLDEITELKLELQPKLLRVLQENEYEPVGSDRLVKNEARIIAATNQDITDLVQRNAFRRDLYYRLNVITIALPPLRERREDIPDLTKLFFAKYNRLYNRSIKGVTDEAMRALLDHSWPGNVRELENVVQRAVIKADGEQADYGDLFDGQISCEDRMIEEMADANGTLEDLDRRYITEILRRTDGHQGQAAKILGIDRKTLYNKIVKYNLGRTLRVASGGE